MITAHSLKLQGASLNNIKVKYIYSIYNLFIYLFQNKKYTLLSQIYHDVIENWPTMLLHHLLYFNMSDTMSQCTHYFSQLFFLNFSITIFVVKVETILEYCKHKIIVFNTVHTNVHQTWPFEVSGHLRAPPTCLNTTRRALYCSPVLFQRSRKL